MKKKPEKEVVVIDKNKQFRVTKDFSTPFDGVADLKWWYFLEASTFNFNTGRLKRDWVCIKCSTSFEEIEKIYNMLLS